MLIIYCLLDNIYIYYIIINWGLGIGDWGLGIGPNPQSPIPNPQAFNLIIDIKQYINYLINVLNIIYFSNI